MRDGRSSFCSPAPALVWRGSYLVSLLVGVCHLHGDMGMRIRPATLHVSKETGLWPGDLCSPPPLSHMAHGLLRWSLKFASGSASQVKNQNPFSLFSFILMEKPRRKGIQEGKTKTLSTHGKKSTLLTMVQHDFHWAPGAEEGWDLLPARPILLPLPGVMFLASCGRRAEVFH